MFCIRRTCVSTALFAILAVQTVYADTVIMDATHLNGSFSSPDVSGWLDGQSPTGWNRSGATETAGLADGGVDAGQYFYVGLPIYGGPEQNWLWRENVYTVAAAGETIAMSYYIGSPYKGDEHALVKGWLQFVGDGYRNNQATGYVDCVGKTLGGAGSLQTLSYTTVADDVGKSLIVAFDFYNSSESLGVQANVDCVTVTSTVVPEPSGCSLLALGIFGMLAYTWRKRR